MQEDTLIEYLRDYDRKLDDINSNVAGIFGSLYGCPRNNDTGIEERGQMIHAEVLKARKTLDSIASSLWVGVLVLIAHTWHHW